jgi:hypothetical protein
VPDLTTFQQYCALADQLIEQSSKEAVAECARLLAMNLAHYEMRYGALPLDDTLAALSASEPNEDQAELLTRGMENLVGLLGNVLSGLGEGKH